MRVELYVLPLAFLPFSTLPHFTTRNSDYESPCRDQAESGVEDLGSGHGSAVKRVNLVASVYAPQTVEHKASGWAATLSVAVACLRSKERQSPF